MLEYYASHRLPGVGKSALVEEIHVRFDLVDYCGPDCRVDYRQDHEGQWLRGMDGHHPGDRRRHHRGLPDAPGGLRGEWRDDLHHHYRRNWCGDPDMDRAQGDGKQISTVTPSVLNG